MKLVTYNLRCCYDSDGIQSFVHRVGLIHDKITREQPDVIAFQEVIQPSLTVLEKLLPDYQFVGQFRDGNYEGEGLFTAVKKSTCQVLGLESIWLSSTPYLAGSRYENQSQYPRICVQTLIRHKRSGQMLRVFNLHLDHESVEARLCGLQGALDFVSSFEEKGEYPIAIMGDFNDFPDSEVIAFCNAYPDIREVTGAIDTTFHMFGERQEKIDYIYLSDQLADQVRSVAVWDDRCNSIYLSDHYPVCVEL